MEWGQFKKAVEAQGIKDEMEIWYIDVTFPEAGHIHVTPQQEGTENHVGLTIW